MFSLQGSPLANPMQPARWPLVRAWTRADMKKLTFLTPIPKLPHTQDMLAVEEVGSRNQRPSQRKCGGYEPLVLSNDLRVLLGRNGKRFLFFSVSRRVSWSTQAAVLTMLCKEASLGCLLGCKDAIKVMVFLVATTLCFF